MKRLGLSEIKDVTLGAVRVEECDGGICFHRFTAEQEELYKARGADLLKKVYASAGIKLRFRTDTRELHLSARVSPGSSRRYYSFDVYVDGKLYDCLKNFEESELSGNYTKIKLPMGECSKVFDLGAGEKEVCIYLPWSAKTVLRELSVDEGAYIAAVRPSKRIVCFGDSITQGYDALYPSSCYTARLSEHLDAEELNKAIGAEMFFPPLGSATEDFVPDLITVAYGTNDWFWRTKDEFYENCKGFFDSLRKSYPSVPVIAITPIWRRDLLEKREFGDFDNVEKLIRQAVEDIDNVFVISGFDFVPKDEALFADLMLHPGDRGFKYFAEGIKAGVDQILSHN